MRIPFHRDDLAEIRRHGLTETEARRQLELLSQPRRYVRIVRPCRVGDGIRRLEDAEIAASLARYETARQQGRVMKFVPASGAATRMFRHLVRFFREPDLSWEGIAALAGAGDEDARLFVEFFEHLDRFPFAGEIERRLGATITSEGVRKRNLREILEILLSDTALAYATLPKALIPFHRDRSGIFPPLAEHLREGAAYTADLSGRVRIHFTIAAEARPRFERALTAILEQLQAPHEGIVFEVTFSCQHPATDTLAVDPENRPFRKGDGSLLFRPGGHGALITNLDALGGDIVFIKNIDNVAPARMLPEIARWKRILGGYLLGVAERIDAALETLEGNPTPETIEEIARFTEETVGHPLPAHFASSPLAERIAILRDRLDRPLRVCGMVPNRGEAGGGPFWVRGEDGTPSLRIVERAEIDPEIDGERFRRATHFNPVDLVCRLRDRRGNLYRLERYIDPTAVFITEKSYEGRRLKALERPGLWNGAMAHWNTLFVEVPAFTFNPVKRVNDLLAPAHRSEGES
ncbi:MAG: DUF4301 family protein [Deltaproteobacteria bacterium]|nr:MAG: DUF4301 family protein [Deltaproteobacteria bacterium]